MKRMKIQSGKLALAVFVAAIATSLAALTDNPANNTGTGWQDDEAHGSMIILRGIAADYAPRGLLDDDSAIAYAAMLGYEPEVLDVASDMPAGKSQVQMALDRIRGGDVAALYGFSRGGYNMRTIWNQLSPEQRGRIKKIVIVGAPGVTPANFPGMSDVVIQPDPPEGHMAGPKVLLAQIASN